MVLGDMYCFGLVLLFLFCVGVRYFCDRCRLYAPPSPIFPIPPPLLTPVPFTPHRANMDDDEHARYLLFLRHVQRIEMYTFNSTDQAPVLQYSVEVTKRNPPDGWLTVPAFVSGSPRRPLSKEAFYSKLGQTPDASLPKVEQQVTITFRQESDRVTTKDKVELSLAAATAVSNSDGVVPAITTGDEKSSRSSSISADSEIELVDVEGGGTDVVSPTATTTSIQGRGSTSIVDVFLVCAAIGGGEAKKMACLPEHRHMKLIPWGGVRCMAWF